MNSYPTFDSGACVFSGIHLKEPVCLPGYASTLDAVKTWSPEYLLRTCGSTELPLHDFPNRTIKLEDFVKSLNGNSAVTIPYIRNIWLRRFLPDLVSAVRVPESIEPNWLTHPALQSVIPEMWNPWLEFFFGASGARFPYVHMDALYTHAWVLQIYGAKKIWAWPENARKSGQNLDVTDNRNIDALFAPSKPFTVELGPGDLLLIPSAWWHTAESQTVSITLSGNFVDRHNWDRFFALFSNEREKFYGDSPAKLEALNREVRADFAVPD